LRVVRCEGNDRRRHRAVARSGSRLATRSSRRVAAILAALLAVTAACTPKQESGVLVDTEPERLINTDLTFPKNRTRWSFVGSRLTTSAGDPFPGYRVVLMNPFAARAREEDKNVARGAKLAQLVHEPQHDEDGVRPGSLRRLNLMVKDPERYAETGGWGYASFDGDGRPIPVNARADCLPCHKSGPASLRWPE
jgi:hypothetical protein